MRERGAEAGWRLPVIDLGGAGAIPQRLRRPAAEAFARSGPALGAVELRGTSGVTGSLQAALRAAAALFAETPRFKRSLATEGGAIGYAQRGPDAYSAEESPGEAVKEIFNLRPLTPEGEPAMPPGTPPGAAEAFTRAYRALEGLERMLFPVMSEALSLVTGISLKASFLEETIARHRGVMRLNHYPPDAEGEALPEIRDGAHTDWSSFTLLFYDRPGLELSVEGEWRPVAPPHDGVILLLGDQLHHLSDGAFIAPLHRVKGGGRISLAYFGAEAGDPADERALQPLCPPGRTPRFSPFRIHDYVNARHDGLFGGMGRG